MKKKTSPEIRKAEREAHPGMNHYRIFHVAGGAEVNDLDFWAAGPDGAVKELEIWRKFHDGVEYFYGSCGGYIGVAEDGTEWEYDTMEEMHKDWENENQDKCASIDEFVKKEVELERKTLSDIKAFFESYDPRHGVEKPDDDDLEAKDPAAKSEAVFKDFRFFIDNYDSVSGSSHMRCESWSIDSHIMNDLEFNIQRLIKNKHGIPTRYCTEAVKRMHGGEPGFSVDGWYKAHGYSVDKEEHKLAEQIWNKKLAELLDAVRAYKYYEEYGIVDKTKPDQVATDKKLRSTLPYMPGTNNDFDYKKLGDLSDAAWRRVWEIWADIGRDCWD